MAVRCYTVAIGEALTVGLQAQGVRVAGGGSGGQADRHGVVGDRGSSKVG